uniref:2-oxoglutarate dehydrogenase E1 component n=1 Tax=Tetraselmis sp. GSL018 TaxID=582737 RepID=A0A061RGW0_9CHLO
MGRVESPPSLSGEMRRHLLRSLISTDAMEAFLGEKFPASKRFSMEGCEAVVPGLEAAVATLGALGVASVQVGMPHRGRLNILHNIMGKPLGMICAEMEGSQSNFSVGDVKYHMGTTGEVLHPLKGVRVQMTLAPNPSHLEAVNSVVAGSVRALQERQPDGKRRHAAVLLHGDASFAGLGVVAEGLQQARLAATDVGGIIHIVVNNQIGFTTEPLDGRSSIHCTDLAKGLGVPVLYANADDPEAVVRACQLAAEWRSAWLQDVVVNVVGYRRHGHNEQDDPRPTLPMTCKLIDAHPRVLDLYSRRLERLGAVTAAELDGWRAELRREYEEEYAAYAAGHYKETPGEWIAGNWQGAALAAALRGGEGQQPPHFQEPTWLPAKTLQWLGKRLAETPEGFSLHPSVQQLLRRRAEMVAAPDSRVDMGMAEALAIGALVTHPFSETTEGYPEDWAAGQSDSERWLNTGTYGVRLVGQDVQRGTFNHRHMVLHDQVTGREYVPINNLQPKSQERLQVHNSLLNEYASLGFEYGYSVACQGRSLVIWEAQFGDFANNAQVMIDQFVASGEAKWGQESGLVLALPHGFEGMGPDHSSARIERFLQLANDDSDHLPGYTPLHRRQIQETFDALSTGESSKHVAREKVLELLAGVREDGHEAASRETNEQLWSELGLPEGEPISFDRWQSFMVQYIRRHAESEANFFLVNATTPAQLFHVLRRQMNRPYRKPLVLITHKFLLHHRPCTSALRDFTDGTFFNRVIDDGKGSDNTRHLSKNPQGERYLLDPPWVRRVILCSGAIYYKLSQARRSRRIRDIVLVRLEQIAPFPHDLLTRVVGQYENAEVVWCQEEPKNMGAWRYVRPRFETAFRELGKVPRKLKYVGRPTSASTATASFAIHQRELQEVIEHALTPEPEVHNS